jgi:aspartate aminotransferase
MYSGLNSPISHCALHLYIGACRLVGEFIAKFMGNGNEETVIYMPDPTWGNHIPIMKNSGLKVVFYRYFEPKTKGFDFAGMMADVKAAKSGSAFLLHACAHNPTGLIVLTARTSFCIIH